MARPHKTDEGTGKPISIRLTDELQAMLELTAKKLDLPVSAVMRLCFRVGSAQFKRVNYDLASAILDAPDAAAQTTRAQKNFDSLVVAATSRHVFNEDSEPCSESIPPRRAVNYKASKKQPAEKTGTED
jgi:hypothetical protein